MTTIPAQSMATDAPPSQADAQLVLQLAQLASTPSMERGQGLLYQHRETGGLTYEQFRDQYPTDSAEAVAIISVLRWHETVATLVKQGLLHRGLVYDWLWVAGSWQLCRHIALGMRAEAGNDALWENFEALAQGQPD